MAINILFDSSFLLHRNLFSLANNSSGRFFDDPQDEALFVKKLMEDISSIVAIFPKSVMGKLVWAKDSRSWRKDLIERISYKGTRVKDEVKVNWDEFHRVSNEFAEVISQCGFIISSENKAEADDLLYLWSQHFLERGESSIIVTSDRDLNQCVRYNGSEIVCIYNPMFKSRKFTFHHDLDGVDWKNGATDIDDLFSMGEESSAEKIHKISSQYEQEFVDPMKVSIVKVFEGDKGDNVPSALQWKKTDSEGNERTYSFTQRMVEKLMDGIGYGESVMHDLRFNPTFRTSVAKHAIEISKQPLTVEQVTESILDNITIMYLDRTIIPEEIQLSNTEMERTSFDLSESKVYSIRPDWTYSSKKDGGIDSDIFSMMS
jgi:5'-3' exonuclease